MDYYEKFRQNLKKIRSAEGITAKELSEKAGLRQKKRIADIEDGRGKPTLDEVIAICEVLNEKLDNMLLADAYVRVDWAG
ncbi:MAG: helix-turn-helix transcriptional regulator [Fulvivirga sp.]|nr:helix-turn-helix transcriptional regulator [Fulvivirga sp.]